jgi:hypothetical protein
MEAGACAEERAAQTTAEISRAGVVERWMVETRVEDELYPWRAAVCRVGKKEQRIRPRPRRAVLCGGERLDNVERE